MFAVPEANTDIGEIKEVYSWFDYIYNVLMKQSVLYLDICIVLSSKDGDLLHCYYNHVCRLIRKCFFFFCFSLYHYHLIYFCVALK